MRKKEFARTNNLGKEDLKKHLKTNAVTKSRIDGKSFYNWNIEHKGGNEDYDLDYEFTIPENTSFGELNFQLKPNQSIISDGGSMSYMREGVERGKLSDSGNGGLFSGIGRLFSGQSTFMVSYTGLEQGDSNIVFASTYPGDILHLTLKPEEELIISRGSFLACSPNMEVSGKMNWRGLIDFGQEEGGVLPKITNKSSKPGHVWLGTYGRYKKHEIQEGESLLVDNGLFLSSLTSANNNDPIYTLVNLGRTITSTIFGKEGMGMKFSGPRTVYTQSHNFNSLVAEIARVLDK